MNYKSYEMYANAENNVNIANCAENKEMEIPWEKELRELKKENYKLTRTVKNLYNMVINNKQEIAGLRDMLRDRKIGH